MTAIYLLVVLSPLAPTMLHSPALAHALTGECSGDCGICGCAPERSAARACCCWQQKLARENRAPAAIARAGCCNKAPAPQPAAATGCCDKKSPVPAATATGCCNSSQKESLLSSNENHPAEEHSGETTISATPCGSSKMLALAGTEKIQHLPFSFSSTPPCQLRTPYSPSLSDRLASLPGEPPDPPPKIAILS